MRASRPSSQHESDRLEGSADPTGTGRPQSTLQPAPGRPRIRGRFRLRTSGIEATTRLGGWAVAAGLRRGVGALRDSLGTAADRRSRQQRRRARELEGLVRILGDLKGAFAKAGQFASLRVDLADPVLREALAGLRDAVPPLPVSEIEAVVAQELGAPVDQLFSRFDPVPLGAASIAQVHLAELPDGSPVAVKVQYPWIADSLRSDLWVVRRALRLWTRIAARDLPNREQIVAEFGRGLAEELDFVREAAIAREIGENLAPDPQILVPEVVASHSSRRVLTMHYRAAVGVEIGRAAGRERVSSEV